MVREIIHLFFLCYTILLFVRVMGSWFPQFQEHRVMRFSVHYTEPYLSLFRRVVPPLGGMIDLSPLIGFFVLRLAEKFLLGLFR